MKPTVIGFCAWARRPNAPAAVATPPAPRSWIRWRRLCRWDVMRFSPQAEGGHELMYGLVYKQAIDQAEKGLASSLRHQHAAPARAAAPRSDARRATLVPSARGRRVE